MWKYMYMYMYIHVLGGQYFHLHTYTIPNVRDFMSNIYKNYAMDFNQVHVYTCTREHQKNHSVKHFFQYQAWHYTVLETEVILRFHSQLKCTLSEATAALYRL